MAARRCSPSMLKLSSLSLLLCVSVFISLNPKFFIDYSIQRNQFTSVSVSPAPLLLLKQSNASAFVLSPSATSHGDSSFSDHQKQSNASSLLLSPSATSHDDSSVSDDQKQSNASAFVLFPSATSHDDSSVSYHQKDSKASSLVLSPSATSHGDSSVSTREKESKSRDPQMVVIRTKASTWVSSASATSHGGYNTAESDRQNPNPRRVIRKKSNLEKVEEDLAKARKAIRRVIVSRNYTYTTDTEDSFVPKGTIYRNPVAFYQSHKEMIKRFRVWTYTEGEPPLFHDGPVNDIYGIEGQFMDEFSSDGLRKSPFRARRPEEAHVFFVPLSVAKVIHFVYKPITSVEGFSRARLHTLIEDYIGIISAKHPYWNRSRGADHFMVSCHDWAPDISDGNPTLFEKFIRGLCNANTSEGFRPNIDVSIPEIYLPKGKLGPSFLGRSPRSRPILAFFAGRTHGNIRKILFKHWKNKDDDVQVYESLPPDKDYTKMMGQSKFCLCPSGWEVASPREVEAIHAGCVPVIISENYSLPFHDVLDWNSFSIRIPISEIRNIKTVLQNVSNRRYLQLYSRVVQVKRHFVLNRPAKPYDVMHMMLHSIWLRRLNLRLIMP